MTQRNSASCAALELEPRGVVRNPDELAEPSRIGGQVGRDIVQLVERTMPNAGVAGVMLALTAVGCSTLPSPFAFESPALQ